MWGFGRGNSNEGDASQSQTTGSQTTPPTNPNPEAQQQNPLDQYKDFFTAPEGKEGIGESIGKMFENINQETLSKHLENTNLVSITAEQLAAMQAGGEDGLKATLQVINNTTKQALIQAQLAAKTMTTHGLTNSSGYVNTAVTSELAKHNAANAVRSLGPAMDHPAMAPMRDKLVEGLARNYPTASQDELRTYAQQVMDQQMRSMGYEKPTKPEVRPEDRATDFSTWL